MKKCPNCHKEYNDDAKFCLECGAQLEKVVEVESEKSTAEQPELIRKPRRTPRWLTVVFSALSFALFSFFMLGYLGPELELYGNSGSGQIAMRITYYFGGGIQNLMNIYNTMPYQEFFVFDLVLYILQCIAFFGGFIATITFSVLGIIDGVKTISEGKDVDTKYLLIVALCAIPHIFFSVAPNVVKISGGAEYLRVYEGWGIGLLKFAFITTFILISAFNIVKNAIFRNGVLKTIFASVVTLFLSITAMMMFEDVVSFSNSAASGDVNAFYALETSLYSFSDGTSNFIGLPLLYGGIAIVFVIISVILSTLSLKSVIKEQYSRAIVFIGANFFSSIIASLFAAGSVGELISDTFNPFVLISGSVIARCFLLILCFVLLIVSLTLQAKENK